MRLDFPDYTKLVTAAYYRKLANRELSFVSESSPAKLKWWCLDVYQRRYLKKDEQALINFFGEERDGRTFLSLIKKMPRDKFKPLDKFLKKGSEKTEDKNIDLLAWLIDFKHRPFYVGMNVILTNDEIADLQNDEEGPVVVTEPKDLNEKPEESFETIFPAEVTEKKEDEPIVAIEPVEQPPAPPVEPTPPDSPQTPPPGFWKKYKKVALTFLTFLLTGTAIILYGKWDRIPEIPMGGTIESQCMYWNGDQYEAASCTKAGAVKMNREKMKTFKRIRDEKKITEELIGIVHYIKDGEIKYYTEGGPYPDDTSRVLRKLSRYMYDKYIRNKDSTDKKLLAERK